MLELPLQGAFFPLKKGATSHNKLMATLQLGTNSIKIQIIPHSKAGP